MNIVTQRTAIKTFHLIGYFQLSSVTIDFFLSACLSLHLKSTTSKIDLMKECRLDAKNIATV